MRSDPEGSDPVSAKIALTHSWPLRDHLPGGPEACRARNKQKQSLSKVIQTQKDNATSFLSLDVPSSKSLDMNTQSREIAESRERPLSE